MSTELIQAENQAVCCDTETCEQPQHFVQPNVSIYETDNDLVVVAEMPGVDESSLEVIFERKQLSLKGEIAATEPEGMTAAWREFEADGYQRTFVVHEEIDRDRIGARIKHGMLTVTLPKAVPADAKRIKVQAG